VNSPSDFSPAQHKASKPNSSTTMPSTFVFRAVGLPRDAEVGDIEGLGQFCGVDETFSLVADSVRFVPSCPEDGETKTGLFSVQSPLPKFLERLRQNPAQTFAFELRDEDVQVDRNFYGFTQMYPTQPGEPITME
jgi:hypothetical protein